jgi:hypothetical protein
MGRSLPWFANVGSDLFMLPRECFNVAFQAMKGSAQEVNLCIYYYSNDIVVISHGDGPPRVLP